MHPSLSPRALSWVAFAAIAIVGCSSTQDTNATSTEAASPATYPCGELPTFGCLVGEQACFRMECGAEIGWKCKWLSDWKQGHAGQDISSCKAFEASGGTLPEKAAYGGILYQCEEKDGGPEYAIQACP